MPDASHLPLVMPPGTAAARLGLPVDRLVRLIRHYRYAWTELAPGGRPGDVGRGRWGLTEAQFEAIVRGQARTFAAQPESDGPASRGPSPRTVLRPPPGGWPSTVGR